MGNRWANEQDGAHLHAKRVPMSLIWSDSIQWLLGSGIRKILGGLTTSMSTLMYAWWENDHDIAYLWAKTVLMGLIGVNPPGYSWVSGMREVPLPPPPPPVLTKMKETLSLSTGLLNTHMACVLKYLQFQTVTWFLSVYYCMSFIPTFKTLPRRIMLWNVITIANRKTLHWWQCCLICHCTF